MQEVSVLPRRHSARIQLLGALRLAKPQSVTLVGVRRHGCWPQPRWPPHSGARNRLRQLTRALQFSFIDTIGNRDFRKGRSARVRVPVLSKTTRPKSRANSSARRSFTAAPGAFEIALDSPVMRDSSTSAVPSVSWGTSDLVRGTNSSCLIGTTRDDMDRSLVADLAGVLDSPSFPAHSALHHSPDLRASPCGVSFYGADWYSQNFGRIPNTQSVNITQLIGRAQRRRKVGRKSHCPLRELVPLSNLFRIGPMITHHLQEQFGVAVVRVIVQGILHLSWTPTQFHAR